MTFIDDSLWTSDFALILGYLLGKSLDRERQFLFLKNILYLRQSVPPFVSR